jgi:hypothetical protein
MVANQPRKTLADYVAIAISPALLMVLIGSLVFFLIEVLYGGDFEGRLRWVFSFFVFGAVLVARISMRDDIAERAGLYTAALGGATWIALQLYVQYPPGSFAAKFGWLMNLFLIGIIIWCAYKLTWDCTYIDDDTEASGKGLLEAAGLDEQAKPEATVPDAPRDMPPSKEKLIPWWQRLSRHRAAEQKKPHAPGVWIVYFSLAALPIFGLLQSFIPVEEVARRQYSFRLMIAYTGSGLGLLLTTSFLGLRRYLRQRRLTMPVTMTGVWLVMGGALIVGLLTLGALLPRPSAEYPLFEFTRLGSPERDASRFAMKGDSPGKGEGRGGGTGKTNDQGNAPGNRQEGQGQGQGDPKSQQGQGAGKQGGQGDKQGQSGGQGQGQGNKDKAGGDQGGQRGDRGGERSNQARGQEKDRGPGDRGKDGDRNGKADGQQRDDKKDESKNDGGQDGSEQGDKRQQGANGSRVGDRNTSQTEHPPDANERSNSLAAVWDFLAKMFRCIVYIAIAIALLYLALRFLWNGLRYLAHFTEWARQLLGILRDLWESLFGWWGRAGTGKANAAATEEPVVLRPFSAYANPFRDGSARRWPPERLVRYSFEALQAWAREADLERQRGETPLEFAERVAAVMPALERDVGRLASFYVGIAYARQKLTPACLEPLEQFWSQLAAVAERPLSATAR